MKKRSRNILTIYAFVFSAIIVAVFCNIASKRFFALDEFSFLNKLFNYLRIFIYIGMFSVWGVSVKRRVLQLQARRFMLSVSALMVMWMIIREFRFRYVLNTDVSRYLWYIYYVPLLLIPVLALLISLSLGKPNSYRLPAKTAALYLPSVILIITVLTNDLHQLVFGFGVNSGIPSDMNYTHGIAYYIIFAWITVCSLGAFSVMTAKTKRFALIPIVPVILGLIYSVIYLFDIPFFKNYLGDISIVYCLVFGGFFEACIQCGFIQSNTRYAQLFRASVDTPVQITDREYNLRYSASAAEAFSADVMKSAEDGPVILENGKRLHNMPVEGGRAVWTEDISELLEIRAELEEGMEELSERNGLLKLEYEKEKEHKITEERNRLFDLLQTKTQKQLNEIDRLMLAYKSARDEELKRSILARIVVLGTYIKRRKDFVLSMEYADSFPELMLTSALAESCRAVKLLNINSSYYVDTECESVSGETLAAAYDFFEDVVEAVIGNARYFAYRLCNAGGKLRVNILTDCTAISGTVKSVYPDMVINNDDGMEFILTIGGGESLA